MDVYFLFCYSVLARTQHTVHMSMYMYLFNLLFRVVLLATGDENDEYGDEDDAEDEADGADDVGPLDQTLGGVDAWRTRRYTWSRNKPIEAHSLLCISELMQVS